MPFTRDGARFTGVAIGSLPRNPLTHSLFVQDNVDGKIAPGSPQFIVTESPVFLMITTENNIPLVTEG